MRLVYLSPVPWRRFAQRPHKFVEWFHARHGTEVLWIDPYPTRFPTLADVGRVFSGVAAADFSLEIPAWLKLVRPRALPIEPLPGSGSLNRFLWRDVQRTIQQFLSQPDCLLGIGKPSELALQMLSRHRGVPSFYDAMDDFPAFYAGWSRRAMAQREHAVAAQVSKIVVSATALADKFERHKPKLEMVLNACAVASTAHDSYRAPGVEHPVLGYVGTIGQWFDWPMVMALANAKPKLRIRLIGPMYSPPPCDLAQNIEIQPACDHAAAMLAMQEFSVGLIPFKRTDLTASVDPIKYYEYRALGLPIVSTCFGEMALRANLSGVFLANLKTDLAHVLERALAYKPDATEIHRFRNENSWGARFEACGLWA